MQRLTDAQETALGIPESRRPWSGYCRDNCGAGVWRSDANTPGPLSAERDKIRRFITGVGETALLPPLCGGPPAPSNPAAGGTLGY